MADKQIDNSSNGKEYVTVDEEKWLSDRVYTAISMAIAVHEQKGVGADNRQGEDAIEGIVNGTVVEIINTLNLKTEGENIRLANKRDSHLEYDD